MLWDRGTSAAFRGQGASKRAFAFANKPQKKASPLSFVPPSLFSIRPASTQPPMRAAAHARRLAPPRLPAPGPASANAPPPRRPRRPAPRTRAAPASATTAAATSRRPAPTDVEYDAVIVGGGFGGLTVASQLAAAGASVVVLEAYVVPGGSGAHFEAGGCTFDVGASMMFGLGAHGTTNLITRALAAVGKAVRTVPDPTQIHYHLPASPAHPAGLDVKVWRSYDAFVEELVAKFPAEEAGIKKFYGECWRVFDALNALDLKSLEEPRYLLGGEWFWCFGGEGGAEGAGGRWWGDRADGKLGDDGGVCLRSHSLLSLLPPHQNLSHHPQSLSSARSPASRWPPSWPPTRATWRGATSGTRNSCASSTWSATAGRPSQPT